MQRTQTTIEAEARQPGTLTRACRWACSVLVVSPGLYWVLVTDGDAYHFLALVVLAPFAALVLFANSLFCLYRYRGVEAPWVGLGFIVLSAMAILEAWYFLPQFGM